MEILIEDFLLESIMNRLIKHLKRCYSSQFFLIIFTFKTLLYILNLREKFKLSSELNEILTEIFI